jgi:hypothetical protein
MNRKTAGRTMRTDAEGDAGREAGKTALRTAPPAPALIALAPSFVALADQFGMVPERLAERVISAFAATRPARIMVRARASSGQSVR